MEDYSQLLYILFSIYTEKLSQLIFGKPAATVVAKPACRGSLLWALHTCDTRQLEFADSDSFLPWFDCCQEERRQ